jgi:hypothetical protein
MLGRSTAKDGGSPHFLRALRLAEMCTTGFDLAIFFREKVHRGSAQCGKENWLKEEVSKKKLPGSEKKFPQESSVIQSHLAGTCF